MKNGVDIIRNIRVKNIVDNKRSSFYRRIFTENEVEYIQTKNHDYKTVAGLFAAKEAISKIFGTGIGELSWKDIEILHTVNGKPYVLINKKIESKLIEINCNEIEISISHEEEYSIAFAIGYISDCNSRLIKHNIKARRIGKDHSRGYKRNLR